MASLSVCVGDEQGTIEYPIEKRARAPLQHGSGNRPRSVAHWARRKAVLMRWQRSLLLACFAAGLVGYAASAAGAADKDKASNKEKIVGTWSLVKADSPNTPPPGTLVEFLKDGKLKITVTVGEKKLTLDGKYSVEGDTLKTTVISG